MSVEDLKDIKVVRLREIARENNIQGYYKMRKDELIEAISEGGSKKIENEEISEIMEIMESEPKIHELRKIAKRMGISFQRKIKKSELIIRVNREISKNKFREVAELRNISSKGSENVDLSKEIIPEKIPDLKQTYGKDKIVALPVNPEWIYFYWDFSNQTKNLLEEINEKKLKSVLRVYDVTYIIFNRNNAHKSWDYELNTDTRNYYINVPFADASYIAEIGYIDEKGEFIPVLRSNSVHTPPRNFSSRTEERWLELDSGYKFSQASEGILANADTKKIGISSLDYENLKEKNVNIKSGGGSFIFKEGGLEK